MQGRWLCGHQPCCRSWRGPLARSLFGWQHCHVFLRLPMWQCQGWVVWEETLLCRSSWHRLDKAPLPRLGSLPSHTAPDLLRPVGECEMRCPQGVSYVQFNGMTHTLLLQAGRQLFALGWFRCGTLPSSPEATSGPCLPAAAAAARCGCRSALGRAACCSHYHILCPYEKQIIQPSVEASCLQLQCRFSCTALHPLAACLYIETMDDWDMEEGSSDSDSELSEGASCCRLLCRSLQC